jgi:luciferase family oxidoreductase group 1
VTLTASAPPPSRPKPERSAPKLRLGLLDLAWAEPPRTHASVARDVLALAPLADELGFSRYWLAEHHSEWVAHASPELLLPLLAGMTNRIRVGTAGVLLGYYSPYKIACNFRLLEALFPGRIDLGIARGKPDGNAGEALLDGRTEDVGPAAHAQRVERLLDALAGRSETAPTPHGVSAPAVWLLGSSAESGTIAAQRGAAFSLSLFFKAWMDRGVLQRYRDEFRPSDFLAEPCANIAVAGACGETRADALRILARYHNSFMLPTVIGTPEECAEQLHEIAAHYAVDEVIFMDAATRLAERSRTCEMLATAVGLEARLVG